MKQQLLHLPLERYSSRYTSELSLWESSAFESRFTVESILPPQQGTQVIQSGEVLDSYARPSWALQQINEVLKRGPHYGKIYCSDFYTPGLDAIPYSRGEFKAFAFCWAQTFDQYDFTRRLFTNWMRPWEIMAFEIYSRVYVACPELADFITAALPHVEEKVSVVGLPYNHRQVFSMLRSLPTGRNFDIVYAARWDEEKCPMMFLELVKAGNFKAVVCTGHSTLKGTDRRAIDEAMRMKEAGKLTILTNLSRADYFYALASSNVIFNCGLQDWVSYTLLDAVTFGCMPLYPAHRSFPRTLYYADEFLYPPGDLETAVYKAAYLIQERPPSFAKLAPILLNNHDSALTRITEDIYAS